MAPKQIARIALVGLLVFSLAIASAPTASAERIKGCADGWEAGDGDCFLGDYDIEPDCLGFRECDYPPDS